LSNQPRRTGGRAPQGGRGTEAPLENGLDCAPFKALLLDLARERSVEALLWSIVRGLAECPHVALARIWVLQPGDVCGACPMRAECPDRTTCLHLAASAGRSVCAEGDWSRLDGAFGRVPLGARKVGVIAARGEAIEVADLLQDAQGLASPEWAQKEGIRGFGGQPLLHNGQVLGVLGVFCRIPLVGEKLFWLRMIADRAAAAIANARASEEIERLRTRLRGRRRRARGPDAVLATIAPLFAPSAHKRHSRR
jgi:GAF domain-containing protein